MYEGKEVGESEVSMGVACMCLMFEHKLFRVAGA